MQLIICELKMCVGRKEESKKPFRPNSGRKGVFQFFNLVFTRTLCLVIVRNVFLHTDHSLFLVFFSKLYLLFLLVLDCVYES